jgi:hypothetical protein
MVKRYAHFAPEQLRAAAARLATFSSTVPENETPEPVQGLVIIGSPTRARTWDLRINSPSLYQLSYRGTTCNYSGAVILGSNQTTLTTLH